MIPLTAHFSFRWTLPLTGFINNNWTYYYQLDLTFLDQLGHAYPVLKTYYLVLTVDHFWEALIKSISFRANGCPLPRNMAPSGGVDIILKRAIRNILELVLKALFNTTK
jgi:hypothetical protein